MTQGGEAGSALAAQLNLPISADALLRDIKLQPLPKMTKAAQESSRATLERRRELYRQVNDLYASGMGLLPISEKLGINRQTVILSRKETSGRFFLTNN